MIFPYFLLDFTDKYEYISTNYFRIESFVYRPNATHNFEPVLNSDKFKTQREYYSYLSENNIYNIENRYVQDMRVFKGTIGNFLLDFLNTNSIDKIYIKKLIFRYGIATLNNPLGKNFHEDFNLFYNDPRTNKYDESIDIDYFDSRIDFGIEEVMNLYIFLHKVLRDLINFSYNIIEESYLNGLSPSQRYYIFHNYYKEDEDIKLSDFLTDVSFNQNINFTEYDNSIKESYFSSPESLAKYLKNECKKNHNFHIKNYFYSFNSLLSVYYFSVLYFIENNIPIKICKNCGKYFVPENRNSSIYCNRIYKDKKTCKEIGANIAYNEKLRKDEVNALYRKTLSAKKMLANRNPDIPMYLEKYEKWKAEANQFKQDIKSGIKTQEEFKEWIENTKKSY